MKSHTLNQDQEAAASAVTQFLLSSDKEFRISGPAGTGKTFMMHHIMETILAEYSRICELLGDTPVQYEIALTATTNKATEVLSLSTGLPAQTIHSFMNLKVYDDYSTGQSKISRKNTWKVHNKTLLFIDEASMVDQTLYKFLQEGTDNTCKIIYLGDHCQLAPVHETLSAVYKTQTNTSHLTIPVRNAGQPALVALCNQLREDVEHDTFSYIYPTPGVIDYVDESEALAFIDSTFKTENPDARILCYSNTRVNEYNQYIRNLRGHPEQFTAGESVVNNGAIEIGQLMLKVEQEFRIHSVNSTPYAVLFDKDQAELDVYDVTLFSTSHNHGINVKLPANPDHFKSLMRHYSRLKDWTNYFFLKNNFPDLRPRDAATVYKAQGSTYHTVFIDLTNIGKSTDDGQIARMLYVGASRATTRLLLHGLLPSRLLSKVKEPLREAV